MRGSKYTILFAIGLSAICAVLLSGVYMLLKERQDENRALEQRMSILKAAGIAIPDPAKANDIYETRVRALLIDKRGALLSDAPSKIESSKDYSVLYRVAAEAGDAALGYVYPVMGSGLWSKLYGYLAVDTMGKNILGMIFYKQGETPGLGAEIERAWFTDSFKGKTLFDGERLIGVKVAKGSAKLDPVYKTNSESVVDGISGATITGNGVTQMLISGPLRYEPFFKTMRR